MEYYFNKISWNRFATRIILYCAIIDYIVLDYIYKKFTNPIYLNEIIAHSLKLQGVNINNINMDELNRIFSLINTMIIAIIAVVILIHGAIYITFYLKKNFAIKYIKVLSLSGIVLIPLSTLGPLISGNSEFVSYSFLTLLYLYVFYAMKLRNFDNEN